MTTVAIDFGTSNTVISTLDPATKTPNNLRFEQISRCFETTKGSVSTVPSLVFVQEPERLLLGEPARSQHLGVDQPSRLFRAFKGDLAAEYRPPARQIDGHTYTSESISEFFLQQIWQQVVSQQLQPSQVIFTVPVGSFDRYLNWFQELAQKLNLPTVQIVDESTAAAFGYGTFRSGEVVLAVNFGGGTLDLSLVRTVAANRGQKVLRAEVLATSDAYVGGDDIDTWIVENYLQKIGASRAEFKQRDWENLLDVAERLKIKLSTATEAQESWFDAENSRSHELHLSREEFEEILSSGQLLSQVEQALDELLAIALNKGISKEEIDQVLLVGGSCQIRAVQQLLISHFGQQKVKLDKPLEAVAHGALALGQIVGAEDYLEHSYVIRLWDSRANRYFYFSLFDKGTKYPSQRPKSLILQAARDEQKEILLDIGELREVTPVEVTYNAQGQITSNQLSQQREIRLLQNQHQQVCVMPLTPPGQTEKDRFELTFELNQQRVLLLTVKDLLAQRVLMDKVAMAVNPNQTRIEDAISDSQSSAPVDGAVLGGLAGAKRQLGTIVGAQPIAKESNEPQLVQTRVNWRLLECRYHLTGHANAVTSVAISPDGQTLASGSRDKTIRLWHLPTGEWRRTLTAHSDAVSDLAISLDGKLLATGSQDKTVKLWHLRSGTLLRTFTNHGDAVFSVALSADGQILASGSWEEAIVLRQIFKKVLPRQLRGHLGGVAAIAFSPDGQTLVSCGDKTIKVWHQGSGQLLHTFSGHSDLVLTIAISPNGQLLASGSGMTDKTIKLWDLGTGELLYTLSGHSSDVLSVAFSPDGQTLASGSYRKLHLWDLGTGELLHSLSGHSGDVSSVAFSPDGQLVVSGSADGTIKVWGESNSGA
ncbi:MAG: Hsp70 family protein [Xenococcaceae cyanobacterium]